MLTRKMHHWRSSQNRLPLVLPILTGFPASPRRGNRPRVFPYSVLRSSQFPVYRRHRNCVRMRRRLRPSCTVHFRDTSTTRCRLPLSRSISRNLAPTSLPEFHRCQRRVFGHRNYFSDNWVKRRWRAESLRLEVNRAVYWRGLLFPLPWVWWFIDRVWTFSLAV